MKKLFKAFLRDECGVSAMEYAILATFVVVALGAIAVNYRTQISNVFATLYSQASKAQNGSGS